MKIKSLLLALSLLATAAAVSGQAGVDPTPGAPPQWLVGCAAPVVLLPSTQALLGESWAMGCDQQ